MNVAQAIPRLVRLRFGRPLVQRANLHRDRSEWIDAVICYRRALEWLPWRDDLLVQIGNCLKEYGDYRGAMQAYGGVTAGANRPEALKQMGDTNRRAGTIILPYTIGAAPDAEAGSAPGSSLPPVGPATLPNRLQIETLEPRRWLGSLGREGGMARRWKGSGFASITLDQVGSLSMVREGALEPLLVAVVAIRARILSMARIETVEIWLGEGEGAERIATVPVRAVERSGMPIRLSVMNFWLDSSRLPLGRHWLSLRCGGKVPPAGLFVNVGAADPDADFSASNAFVPAPATGDLDQAIEAAPAVARPAARALFDRPIRSVLAMRVDQLGDVSASLPALARLRTLFPDAKLTVLVQPAVRAIIEASGLADAVLTLELAYDTAAEQRYLASAEEARVRALLSPQSFDLAIDLCSGDETRPLLLLTGAVYLVGFNADRFTFLDFGIGLRSRDKVNQLEMLSHAATVLTLVEALAVAIAPERAPVRRIADSRPALAAHGLQAGHYVVLHLGARHAINRWPTENFYALASALVAETPLTVVIFAEGGGDAAPASLRGDDRVRFLGVIDPDTFDAIVSSARLLVGNDSGPKHLAAARGVPTVSIHVDRLNWNEWGQDSRGTILSKRVPCTGCGLNDIQLCGRDAVCVRSIRVDEVMEAARLYL